MIREGKKSRITAMIALLGHIVVPIKSAEVANGRIHISQSIHSYIYRCCFY